MPTACMVCAKAPLPVIVSVPDQHLRQASGGVDCVQGGAHQRFAKTFALARLQDGNRADHQHGVRFAVRIGQRNRPQLD